MKGIILILIVCLSGFEVFGQSLDKLKLEKVIDSVLHQFNNPESPGVAITVLQNGHTVAQRNYGMANLEHKIPFQHTSPVRLVYSMGREFMSVGLAIMESEGLLQLQDKVRQYLPRLPEWSKDVTLQDLLNHSSGFDDEWSLLLLMTSDMRSQVDDEQVLSLLYNQPKPQIEPKKGYMYNNTDFALLRFCMEIASGQRLPDYLKTRLFEPLGMSATFMNDDIEELIPRFAEDYYGYKSVRKGRFIKFSPGGNYRIVITANDLVKWALAVQDSNSVVATSFRRLYKDARPIPVISPERHYIFGHEWRTINATEVVCHGGVDDSFYMIRIPSKNITVVGLGNGGNYVSATIGVVQSMLPVVNRPRLDKRYFPSNRVTSNARDLMRYTGRYFLQRVGFNSHIIPIRFFDVKLEGDSLNYYPGASTEGYSLTFFGDGYFMDLSEGAMMHFTQTHADSAMRWQVWRDDETPLILLRQEKRVDAGRDYLQQFTGQYYSPHLDFYLRIVLTDRGELVIRRPMIKDTRLDPGPKNQFMFEIWNGGYSSFATATFKTDKKGKVNGFTLQDSRMMHHRFEKVKRAGD